MHRALLNFHVFSWETRPQGQKACTESKGRARPHRQTETSPSRKMHPNRTAAADCLRPFGGWFCIPPPAGEVDRAGRARRAAGLQHTRTARRGPALSMRFCPRPLKEVCLHHAGRRPPFSAVLRFCGSTVLRQKNAAPRRKRFLPGRCVQLVHQNFKKGLSASSTASAGRAENGRIGSGLSPYGASGFSNQATSHHRPDL